MKLMQRFPVAANSKQTHQKRNMANLQSLRQYDVATAACELNTALVGLQQIRQVSFVTC